MEVVNMHAAKTQLSQLVLRAAGGETILIAKSGRPMAQLMPLPDGAAQRRQLGFLVGRAEIPEDFDQMGADAIAGLFEGR